MPAFILLLWINSFLSVILHCQEACLHQSAKPKHRLQAELLWDIHINLQTNLIQTESRANEVGPWWPGHSSCIGCALSIFISSFLCQGNGCKTDWNSHGHLWEHLETSNCQATCNPRTIQMETWSIISFLLPMYPQCSQCPKRLQTCCNS